MSWLVQLYSHIYLVNFAVFKLEARCFNFSETKKSFQQKDASPLVS